MIMNRYADLVTDTGLLTCITSTIATSAAAAAAVSATRQS